MIEWFYPLCLLADQPSDPLNVSINSILGAGGATGGIALIQWVRSRLKAAQQAATIALGHLESLAKFTAVCSAHMPQVILMLDQWKAKLAGEDESKPPQLILPDPPLSASPPEE